MDTKCLQTTCQQGMTKRSSLEFNRDFINTPLFVQKHVRISVDKWIVKTTCPHKHVTILEYLSDQFLCPELNWKLCS